MPPRARRAVLAEAATDHALRHGLIGLSLRPLAAAIGTSDRMLLYHFRDKDDLVATVLRVASDQAVAEVTGLPVPQGVRAAVLALWGASSVGLLERCERLYVQAAALGLLGQEPYVSVVREANERWVAALASHLGRAGCPEDRARRAALLVDATFMGLHLDLPVDGDDPEVAQAVVDLATAVEAIAHPA
jgi:AcrR family transcriptional regulator